jgi:hypothetical protein
MSRLFKVIGLDARKRALVEESEVYREMLKLQVRNLTLYSLSLRQQMQSPSALKSWAMLALPFAFKFFRRSSSRQKGFLKGGTLGAALMAFRTARRFAPMLMNFFSTFFKGGVDRRHRRSTPARF